MPSCGNRTPRWCGKLSVLLAICLPAVLSNPALGQARGQERLSNLERQLAELSESIQQLKGTGAPAIQPHQNFADLPGYERYQQMSQNSRTLVTGGTISGARWSDDGESLSFQRDGKSYRVKLADR